MVNAVKVVPAHPRPHRLQVVGEVPRARPDPARPGPRLARRRRRAPRLLGPRHAVTRRGRATGGGARRRVPGLCLPPGPRPPPPATAPAPRAQGRGDDLCASAETALGRPLTGRPRKVFPSPSGPGASTRLQSDLALLWPTEPSTGEAPPVPGLVSTMTRRTLKHTHADAYTRLS